MELRYYLGQAHYRSNLDYSEESLREAATAYQRMENFVVRVERGRRTDPPTTSPCPTSSPPPSTTTWASPKRWLWPTTPCGKATPHLRKARKERAAQIGARLRAMLAVLGLDPLSPQWAGSDDSGLHDVVDSLVSVVLEQRQEARKRKDYAAADRIRDQLAEMGIAVEDTPQGPRWELKRS